MPDVSVNYLAILASAVSYMTLGALWYSPLLLGKAWEKLMGRTEQERQEMRKGVWRSYFLSFLAALVMAYVLAHIINYAEGTTVLDGFMSGVSVWIGFVITTGLATVVFEGRKWELYMINNGYYLVSLVVMGIILAIWR